jgi:basic membrane protein A
MKKMLAFLLAAVMMLSLCACGGSDSGSSDSEGSSGDGDFKVGAIMVGDENEGYSESHIKAVEAMKEELGLSDDQVIVKTNIGEDESCYDAAVDLAEQGCDIIFANSFSHEDYMIQAAQDYPDVQFCHSTGFQAKSSGLPNMHNFFYAIYEARFVSGVVAGLKLNEMIANGEITEDQCKIGYVGAYPYAEVVSGFTSFFLGARSVCPSATMEVKYTNSWASMDLEAECAKQLIADGCVLISQHADTTGAPSVCETQKVPCVGYNVDMIPTAPNYALTSAAINWAPYYTSAVESAMKGEEIPVDWCKGYESGGVLVTTLNDKAVAAGTQEKVDEAWEAITSGNLKVFDTSTFTVDGKTMEELVEAKDERVADIADLVSDGYFHESDVDGGHTSAPAFTLRIDGITE